MKIPPPTPADRARHGGWLLPWLSLAAFGALTPHEWQHRQVFTVNEPGLTRIAVTAETMTHAQPSLSDMRILDEAGREVPYWIDGRFSSHHDPQTETPPRVAARNFTSFDTTAGTQLLIETGLTGELEAIELTTSSAGFFLAAHVEISADGNQWKSLGPAVPIFRNLGAEQLRLALARQRAAFVRVTLDEPRATSDPARRDATHPRVPFTGALVQAAPIHATPPRLTPLGVAVERREEFAGVTTLTLQLAGRHAPLATLSFASSEPLFMRHVTVAVREMQGGEAGERVIATGTIYRVALAGTAVREQLALPLDYLPTNRELIVHVHNGDSPPLVIDAVHAKRRAIEVRFVAQQVGEYQLLLGNPQVGAPRYDLALFTDELSRAETKVVTAGSVQPMPHYRPRETVSSLPDTDVPLIGAPLDTTNWRHRRPLQLARPGVQQIELDLAVLAYAQPDLDDLRIVQDRHQFPYLLERTKLMRKSSVPIFPAPDNKRPTVSVWRMPLPHVGLPTRELGLSSDTPLFDRTIKVYEMRRSASGQRRAHTLSQVKWSHVPTDQRTAWTHLVLTERPLTDTLWFETDNGDNPAITLKPVTLFTPVVRLVFKADEAEGFALVYGNAEVSAPRYDLRLLARQLLSASRNVATLVGDGTVAPPSPWARLLSGNSGMVLFWATLTLVVIVLLLVVARLLPKPPAG